MYSNLSWFSSTKRAKMTYTFTIKHLCLLIAIKVVRMSHRIVTDFFLIMCEGSNIKKQRKNISHELPGTCLFFVFAYFIQIF